MKKTAYVLAVAALGCRGATMSTEVPPPSTTLASESGPRVRVTVDPHAREIVVDMGPFSVPAMDAAEMGAERPAAMEEHHPMAGGHEGPDLTDTHGEPSPLMSVRWPVDGWLRGFQVRVTDASGDELPRHILHHMIGVNFDRRQLAYAQLERFFGIGTETEDVELPASIGIPMAPGQHLGLYASWHNDTGRDLDRVYVRVAMDYTARAEDADVTSVLPAYFDTDNRIGNGNAWDVPAGRSEKSWEFTVPVSGSLLAATGHLHDYGQYVRLEDAETGAVLFQLAGRRDAEGRLESVQTRIFRKWLGLRSDPIRLEAGHRYRVVGVYENPLDQTIVDGAMAHIVGVFAPDDMAAWPKLDLGDATVQRDLSSLPEPPRRARGGA